MTQIGFDFGFVVTRNDGMDMTSEQSEEMLDAIIDLVEKRNMSMGGGCHSIDVDGVCNAESC